MIAATRLRKGGTNSGRGAARLVGDALATATACGGRGLITVRADSAYYGHDVIAAARRGGARFWVTARMNPTVLSATTAPTDAAPCVPWPRSRRLVERMHRPVDGLIGITLDGSGQPNLVICSVTITLAA